MGIDQQVTFLYTRDLDRAHAFYAGLLHLPLVLDQGGCRIYRTGPGAFLGLCRQGTGAPRPADAPDSVILTLVSDQVDAWHAHLAAQGVRFEKPPTHNPTYNIYHCFLRDPDGHLLEIQRFLDPAWPRP